MGESLYSLSSIIKTTPNTVPIGKLHGKVLDISGLSATVSGMHGFTGVGDRVTIKALDGRDITAEIVAFRSNYAVVMAYDSLEGIGAGCPVIFPLYKKEEREQLAGATLRINDSWLGRVIDPTGQPMDGKGPVLPGGKPQKLHASPPQAASRARLGPRIDVGVKAMNLFTTCRQGQRLGLFAGSGVGKSTLLGMLARNTACDIAVISLVGERGREVREFIEDDLGAEGLARSVVVVATSDTSALMRREAAYTALSAAEYFRDQGKSVLLLMDSVTRFCQALREIGLSAGEPPATRGFPPSVFATLPRLLERAGPGPMREDGKAGQITALFSVLVEGDDQNEPITDAVRGILDGHIIMEREIADSGRYPAINVLKSLSRSVPGCNSDEENSLIREARAILATWDDVKDLVRLGAYKQGADPKADIAIHIGPVLEELITQRKNEKVSLDDAFAHLRQILRVQDHNQ
ncbi:flagellar protein export ATPase FliI [Aristophania vespae]|uniref:flagellar protein export ATPase FliI n=1 Tax=Aristophania vespae TaxID=2697033 RepID=UPI00235173FF|nr:flagellar protein export ATPase FliI [Aristophania vespae]